MSELMLLLLVLLARLVGICLITLFVMRSQRQNQS